MPGKDGLLHISEVRKLAGGKRVENVEDVLGVGQKIMVEITKMDDRGKLSLAPVIEDAEPADTESSVAASAGPEAPAEG
jgi:polyribonucleotide nucleotidyltransferase